MRKLSRFASALVLATFVASGMMAFSVQVNAADLGGGISNTRICQLLAYAESVVTNRLPDGALKTYLLNEIHEQQAAHGC